MNKNKVIENKSEKNVKFFYIFDREDAPKNNHIIQTNDRKICQTINFTFTASYFVFIYIFFLV